jgi:ketopantoate reductase PanE/ApbA-like protein
VRSERGDIEAHPPATDDPNEIGAVDFVFLGLKANSYASALGGEPSVSIEQRLQGAEKAGDHKPSTLQDLEAGKPPELAAIVDSVVELANLTGVPAPSLRAVSAASGLLAETLGLRWQQRLTLVLRELP